MKITRLSTKGQIVIPERFRKDVEIGTPFIVTKKNDLIILKQVGGLTKEEEKEMMELDSIWRDIDEGKGVSLSKEEFFKEMNAW